MFKFLHAADIHLDSPFKGLEQYDGAPVSEFRGATRRALENLVDLAVAERVRFVLIAGDLCDGDWRDYGTGLFLNSQFARLRDAKIPVVMIRGNHDAASLMARHLKPTDNVRELSPGAAESFVVPDCDVVIHGRGYQNRAERDNMAVGYPPAQSGLFNIGLLHTCATGRDGHESYAPCTLDDLRSRGYDYWALGHVHAREQLLADPCVVFPGNTQGRHIRETGAKGCMLVTVDSSGRASAEFRALDVLRWALCRVDVKDAVDRDDMLARASESVATALSERDGRPLAVRLELLGKCPAHDEMISRQESLAADLRDLTRDLSGGMAWVEKVRVRTTPPRVREFEAGPLAELASYLDLLREDESLRGELGGVLSELVRALPLELREGDDALDVDSPARVAELLEEVGPMILEQLAQG